MPFMEGAVRQPEMISPRSFSVPPSVSMENVEEAALPPHRVFATRPAQVCQLAETELQDFQVSSSSAIPAASQRSQPGKAFGVLKKTLRRDSLADFNLGLTSGWGVGEVAAMQMALPPQAVRVLAVRHGMGHHNDMGGALSVLHRDSPLNELGWAQARVTGAVLEQAGITKAFDLVVVSPFTRALETAVGLLGTYAPAIPTFVQPLCAEHTLARSALQQGDRGSTAEELLRRFPPDQYQQYDFSSLQTYCDERGLKGGKWWVHVAGERYETTASFAHRAREFLRWLRGECAKRRASRVLLVSHGGFLQEAFGGRHFGNLECRAIDIGLDGTCCAVGRSLAPADVCTRGGVSIDGAVVIDGTTYYDVLPDEGVPVLRRFSDFASLRNELKYSGKERYEALFPPKLDIIGGRQTQLESWLRAIVCCHGYEEVAVRRFLHPTSSTVPGEG